jgi:hypothetical protein
MVRSLHLFRCWNYNTITCSGKSVAGSENSPGNAGKLNPLANVDMVAWVWLPGAFRAVIVSWYFAILS